MRLFSALKFFALFSVDTRMTCLLGLLESSLPEMIKSFLLRPDPTLFQMSGNFIDSGGIIDYIGFKRLFRNTILADEFKKSLNSLQQIPLTYLKNVKPLHSTT